MTFKTCGLFSAICAGALFCRLAFASGTNQTVSLAWSPDTSGLVAGYVVYYGSVSQNYTTRVDVGTNTQVTLPGFQAQSTNYFAITAYNSLGMESAPSSELAYVVPVTLTILPPGNFQGLVCLQFPVMVGHWYVLQASTDLQNWNNIWQTPVVESTGLAQFTDLQAAMYPKRYYRMVLH